MFIARKKAPRLIWLGAFFLCLASIFSPFVSADEQCPPPRNAISATVAYVDDGDTVRLTNGDRVRLAGIDAPEVAHPAYGNRAAKPAEPFGNASRQALMALLAKSHNRLRVLYGAEPEDRYGRKLAYLYLPDGKSIQADLVARGLAMAVYMPPNLALADCLTAIEKTARERHVGIWSNSEYDPGIATASGIPDDVQGAAIVRGKVLSVHRSRKNVWINLEGRVALQISSRAWDQFHSIDFDHWKGRELRARGWLVHTKSRYEDWLIPIESPRSINLLGR
jgi:endonuclease YncB( thermonuclease family)